MEKNKGRGGMTKNDIDYPPRIDEKLEQLYKNLENIYGEVKFELEDRGLTAADLGVNCDERLKSGKQPLIRPDQLDLPNDLVRRVMLNISDEVSDVIAAKKKQKLQDFASSIERNDLNIDDFLDRFFSNQNHSKEVNSSADKASIGFELFFQIMLFTLRPFLSWLREITAEEVEQSESWRQDTCPFCGAVPELSRLTHEEGKRLLFCWLCGNEWRFERFTCLYCGESQADSQKYFVVKNRPYRVDICQDCNRYLKVIDERRVPETETGKISWLINDLGTDHLDSLAREEGYTRT